MIMPAPIADLTPIHPGEILVEEFLKPHGLSAYGAARRMHVPRTRIERLARGETPVTVDTALRLGRLFGTTAQFWLSLQNAYDLELETPADIAAIQPIAA